MVFNRRFFAAIIVAGLAIGVLYSEVLKKKFYKSTLVLNCDYLNTQVIQNAIVKMNLLTDESTKEGLADFLKIDLATAENIRKFEFNPFVSEDDIVEMEVLREQLTNIADGQEEIVTEVIEKLAYVNKNAYEISVYVYNPDIIRPLQDAMVNYFRDMDYISRRIEIGRRLMDNRKEKLLSESRKLDSLKKVIFNNYAAFPTAARGSGNVFLGDEQGVSPLAVFDQDLVIYDQIQAINRSLFLNSDFELVDGFTTFREPESASLGEILVVALIASWILGYVIIGVWEFDKVLAKIPVKRNAFRLYADQK